MPEHGIRNAPKHKKQLRHLNRGDEITATVGAKRHPEMDRRQHVKLVDAHHLWRGSRGPQAGWRAASLTHRLLAFSRRQTLASKAVNVKDLVNGMTDMIARTVGPAITIETVNGGGLWPVIVDPSQLENVLLNLCINARDAMPDGGKLTIETGNRWLDARTAAERDAAKPASTLKSIKSLWCVFTCRAILAMRKNLRR